MDSQERSSLSGAAVTPTARGPRPCGTCTTCCIWLPIPAGHLGMGEKPAGQKCPHLGVAECAQYAARPRICREFQCSYLKNPGWPEAWRPDQCFLLCLSEVLPSGSLGSAVYELKAGQLGSPVGRAIVEALRQQSEFVVLIDCEGRRLLRPGFRVDQGHKPSQAPHFVKSSMGTRKSKKE